MISIVEGLGVGAGKSFYATTVIAQHVARGGTVYHTDDYEPRWHPLVGPMEYQRPETILGALWEILTGPKGKPRPLGLRHLIRVRYGVEPLPEQLQVVSAKDLWRIHEITPSGTDDCPVLVVADESQGGLNARDTMDKKKRPVFDWFCQSRHDNNDLLFITQNAMNVDAQVRRLASSILYTMNLAVVGFPGLGKIPLFLWKEVSPDGKQVRDWWFKRRDPLIFGAYESKACKGKHTRLNDQPVQRKQLAKVAAEPTEKKPMKLFPIFLVCGLLFALVATGRMFWKWMHPKVDTTQTAKPHASGLSAPVVTSGGNGGALGGVSQAKERKRFFRTVAEEFRGTDGKTFLHTSGGEYRLHSVCPLGLVDLIDGDSARITDEYGELVFVVGTRDTTKRLEIPEPPKTYAGGSATWEPVPSPIGDRESARMRAELERPIGAK